MRKNPRRERDGGSHRVARNRPGWGYGYAGYWGYPGYGGDRDDLSMTGNLGEQFEGFAPGNTGDSPGGDVGGGDSGGGGDGGGGGEG